MSNEQLNTPELAAVQIEADDGDLTRSEVILKGALAAGAVYGALPVGPYGRRALAASGGGDVGILNFALTLEYLEAKFYEEAKGRVRANGELMSLIDLLAKDEQQHVEALAGTVKKLGGKPVAEPKFNFEYDDTASFLKLAQTFEDTGVSAYNGAAPLIKSKDLLATAGGIVKDEARHAGAVLLLAGELPAPAAFDATLHQDEVLAAAKPFVEG